MEIEVAVYMSVIGWVIPTHPIACLAELDGSGFMFSALAMVLIRFVGRAIELGHLGHELVDEDLHQGH